jgi:hypothetical protein
VIIGGIGVKASHSQATAGVPEKTMNPNAAMVACTLVPVMTLGGDICIIERFILCRKNVLSPQQAWLTSLGVYISQTL